MNKTEYAVRVMQAYLKGYKIEVRDRYPSPSLEEDAPWKPLPEGEPIWDWDNNEYRIAPPQPLDTQTEFWLTVTERGSTRNLAVWRSYAEAEAYPHDYLVRLVALEQIYPLPDGTKHVVSLQPSAPTAE